MTDRLLRLFPGPPQEAELAGTYLAHGLDRLGSPAEPFVYASFVTSLDGRIALGQHGDSDLPAALVSGADLRLFLELQAQADCLVTHGGYLRALAAGRLDDVLQVGTGEKTRDLAAWRRGRGLAPQPAIVIASASLDFPLPPSPARHGQRVIVATGERAPPEKVARLEAQGCEVIRAGAGASVEGAPLTRAIGDLGFRSAYLLAGPRMLETMLRDGRLGRLYLTLVHRLLGGAAFETMIAGPELGDAGRLRLHSLHYDAGAPDGTGQWFAAFEPQ